VDVEVEVVVRVGVPVKVADTEEVTVGVKESVKVKV